MEVRIQLSAKNIKKSTLRDYIIIVKVKLFSYLSIKLMNTYEELEVKIHVFSALALGGGECPESRCLRYLFYRKELV